MFFIHICTNNISLNSILLHRYLTAKKNIYYILYRERYSKQKFPSGKERGGSWFSGIIALLYLPGFMKGLGWIGMEGFEY